MTKVLLALDPTPHSRKALEYAAGVLPHLPGCRVLILTVVTGIPYGTAEAIEAEAGGEAEVHGDEDHRQELQEVETFLRGAAQVLFERGIPRERLETRTRPVNRGVAQDIFDEAAAEGCDTIVVGRRSLSKVKTLLLGSVSNSLMHISGGRAVWVVE